MMKRSMTNSIMILLVLSLTYCAQSTNHAQELKEPVNNTSEQDARFEEILDLGSMAVPDLVDLLNEQTETDSQAANRQWGAKVTAMNILSELKADEALPALLNMLETSDNLSAINNSARTIGRIGGNDAYIILVRVLNNLRYSKYTLNDERKRAVIAALGLCENKKAIPLLLEEMYNRNNSQIIRIYAAGSLALLGRNDGLQTATDGLSSFDTDIKLAAARALGLIGSQSSAAELTGSRMADLKYLHQKAVRLSLIQIEEKQRSGDKKVEFIKQQLMQNPKLTEMLQWGTMKLKKINSRESKKALHQFSVETATEYAILKHAAKIRLKTME